MSITSTAVGWTVPAVAVAAVGGWLAFQGGPGGGEGVPAEVRAEGIPERAAGAISGSEFARQTTDLVGRRRQARAVEELAAGNMPSWLRELKPVRLEGPAEGPGAGSSAVVWVMPDYLAIGSDEDFLRIPLTYPSAVTVAARLGFVLPTRKMVDAIYAQAATRVDPIPMKPGPTMRSMAYYVEHQRRIQQQLAGRPAGELVAGHKKDVVITNRLNARAGRIAIYGWHRSRGKPIQPLSTVHGARYADYSHGLRLVWPTAWIDGRPVPIVEALEDPARAPVLSYEGVLANVRRLLSPRAVAAASP